MFPVEFASKTILNWRPKMKIFPGLQGKKRATVFFIVGLILLVMTGVTFFFSRSMISLVVAIMMLGFSLWNGYKIFGGDDE
jgi:hypothetical protein